MLVAGYHNCCMLHCFSEREEVGGYGCWGRARIGEVEERWKQADEGMCRMRPDPGNSQKIMEFKIKILQAWEDIESHV